MKRSAYILVICFLLTAAAYAQNNIAIYDDCNYSGKRAYLVPGNYRLYQMQIGNDKVSSLQVPPGMRVTLYEHDNFEGKWASFTSNISCLGDDWNDQASSVVVEKINTRPDYNPNDYVTFYNDCYSRGYSRSLRPGTYYGSQLANLYQNISSLQISGNLRVRAFTTSDNVSGYSAYIENSQSCFGESLNDKIRSLIIEYKTEQGPGNNPGNFPPTGNGSSTPVTVYTDCYYRGTSMQLGPGRYQGNDLGLMRYNISSLEIPSNLRVKVFVSSEYLSGTSYILGESSNCLSATLNDRIGSLVIEERSGFNNPQNPNNNNNNNNRDERVIIYEDEDFKGLSSSLLPGTYATMEQAGFRDDALSSLYLPAGYRVVLYEFENFRGKSYTVNQTKSGFLFSNWNDKTSSIAVYRQ